ncbi:MAG: glycosyltransferase [Chloroflexota bacterium]
MSEGARPGGGEEAPVPQHLCLVLPSTGEFDSRTYRIATSCLARGHRVTVLARWQAGLAEREEHPSGYTIVRVRASSVDGLPFPALRARAGALLRRRHRSPGRQPTEPGDAAPLPSRPAGDAPAGPLSQAPNQAPASAPGPDPAPASTLRRASPPRRAFASLVRRLAIPLTIRSHARNALAVAPAADLYHGMAYMGIPVALALGRRHRAPVVYDARDIYLEARNLAKMGGPARWLLARYERGWAHRAARVLTVNEAYAEVMADRFRTEKPLVVMNCSLRFDPPDPPERRFNVALGLDPAVPIVLYHGGLFPERGIEQLVEAIGQIPGAALVLMGYGALEPTLRSLAAAPERADRIHVLPAVPPQDLHGWVAAADVVAMPIQPSTLNHRLTTPNKLFEAMAAGVPVVASDLPGMASIVREVGFGRLCDPADPRSIAREIRAVLEAPPRERAVMRANAREAARTRYNWELQAGILLREYGLHTDRRW